MEIKKRTSILVKTVRRFVVESERTIEAAQCRQCAQRMISAHAAASLFSVGVRAIYRLVESGKIHFAEIDAGEVLVCSVSIERALDLSE